MKRKVITASNEYEAALHNRGIFPVAGVDEAGRGPLAGPVVACAVVLPPGVVIEGVNDSKKMSEKRRDVLAQAIKTKALAYGYGIVEPDEIDRINILQATMKAMEQAVQAARLSLGELIQYVLVDGNRLPHLHCPGEALIGGDSRCHVIAAASILAKVKRDTVMMGLHRAFPQYGFDRHKGYGTAAHRAAITEHGLCPAHRKTFTRGLV